MIILQACRLLWLNNRTMYLDIGDGGTEEMWTDTDGTPYLYYTAPFQSNLRLI